MRLAFKRTSNNMLTTSRKNLIAIFRQGVPLISYHHDIQQKSFFKVNSQFSTLFVGYVCCRRSKLSKSTLTFDRKLQFKQTSWPEDS